MGEVSMVARQTPNLKDRVRFLAPMPKWSCSLTVKHPAYTRHSLQIRERCGFESRQVYQFIFAIALFISTPTIANVQSNTIIHECFAKFDTYMKVANCITVTRNEIQRKKNAEQWEFLKANPR